jgi:hypothetical protein
MVRRITTIISSMLLLLAGGVLLTAFAASGPAKSGGIYEIMIENIDSAGSPASAPSGGIYSILYSLAEPGGITGLSGGLYEIKAGYYGQDLLPPSPVTDLIAQSVGYRGGFTLLWTAPGDDYTQQRIMPGARIHIAKRRYKVRRMMNRTGAHAVKARMLPSLPEILNRARKWDT